MNARIYCDSSVIIALQLLNDDCHAVAVKWKDAHADTLPVWTPFHRIEVFNAFRQHAQLGTISQSEARAVIHRLNYDLGFYWEHLEPDWRDVMRTANEISTEIGFLRRIRALDLLHVAHAREVNASEFVTADERQAAVADAAGIPTTCLA